MKRNNKAFLVVLVTLAVTTVGCGGGPVSPTSLPTTSLPGKSAGTPVNATPSAGFAFIRVEDSDAPASSLPIWGLRGKNSEEAARMMSFCGTGVTVPGAADNNGLRPLRRPAGPFRLIVGPEFSDAEFELIWKNALVMQDELGVPLTVERGTPVPFSKVFGVINVFKNSNYDGAGAASLDVVDNLVTSGDIFWGKVGIVQMLNVRHELGHVVGGLCHHNEEGLMSGLWTKDRLLSKLERDNYNMMSRLQAGEQFPGTAKSSSWGSSSYTHSFEDCFHQ